jgi:hypothetical protein
MSAIPSKRLTELGANKKPVFKYTTAAQTNVAATFDRIRREQAKAAAPSNVKPIKAKRSAA